MNKTLIAPLAGLSICLLPLNAMAYSSMQLNHTDGSTTSVNIEEKMTARVSSGSLIMECSKGTITIPYSEIRSFTFSSQPGTAQWPAGVEAPSPSHPQLNIEGGYLTVSALPSPSQVAVTTLKGVTVASENCAGEFRISLDKLSADEVYIVSFNGKSVKIALNR